MKITRTDEAICIKNKDNNSLSFNKLEEEVGYRNDINYPHRYPQATFRYFLRSLVDKEILIKCNLYRISPLYKVNKKLLKEEIINNELFKEIVKFLKNNAILYGV